MTAPGLARFCVVVVFVGKANALAMMQLLHHAMKNGAQGVTPLEVDDSDARSPAYFFDVTVPHPATLIGVKGMANTHLSALLASAHALVVMSDDAKSDPSVAGRTLAARLPEARREQVYAVHVRDSDEARTAMFAVLEEIAGSVTRGARDP